MCVLKYGSLIKVYGKWRVYVNHTFYPQKWVEHHEMLY